MSNLRELLGELKAARRKVVRLERELEEAREDVTDLEGQVKSADAAARQPAKEKGFLE